MFVVFTRKYSKFRGEEDTVTTRTVMEGMHQVLFRIVEDEDSGRQEEDV